jgi:hypothetical protein
LEDDLRIILKWILMKIGYESAGCIHLIRHGTGGGPFEHADEPSGRPPPKKKKKMKIS